MRQPDELKTNEIYPAAEGRGNEVWAILKAAADGDLDQVRQLLQRNPRLLECGGYYSKPLDMAVCQNRIEVTRFLLDQGADAASRRWSERPFEMAKDRSHAELCKLLETHCHNEHGIQPAGDEIAEAIREWDVEAAKKLINNIPDGARVADQYGNRPIHWAVLTRRMDLIDWLLSHGADVNAVRPDGATPLDLTPGDYWFRSWYRDGHPDAVKNDAVLVGYLLARGANYDIGTACCVGDLGRVRSLIDESPEQVGGVFNFVSLHCGVPLYSAARKGYQEIVGFLLERGADPNQPQAGAPLGAALHGACWQNHLEVVTTLLEAGADPNQEVDGCVNCLLVTDSDEIKSLLESRGAVFPLWHIAREGLTDLMADRLAEDPSLANDIPVFHEAALSGKQELTDLFLQHEPDLWQRMPALASDDRQKTEWMFGQGMDANSTNWLELSALHLFASHGDIENAELFLQYGAELNPIDFRCQSTPLGYAAKAGQSEMVKFLLDKGADRSIAGADWATPTAWAERRRRMEIVEMLNRD